MNHHFLKGRLPSMGFDIQKMLKQAQKMQEQMNSVQEELDRVEVTGSAGGGAVTVVCNGKHEFKKVTISPEAAGDAALLEDLVLTALKDASKKVSELAEAKFGEVTQGISIPGLKFPGF
jgi:DNA-binding YbaB/EbfC family protein